MLTDPIAGVSPEQIRWFHNGVWQTMPHAHFFCNNVRHHFKRTNRHMPVEQKRNWEAIYKAKLLSEEIIHVNNLAFKLHSQQANTGNQAKNL